MDLAEELERLGADDITSSDDSRVRRARRGTDDESEDIAHTDDDEGGVAEVGEEEYRELRATVVEIVSALGGLEESVTEQGTLESVYVLGDDVLRCLRDLRTLWRQDEEDMSRLVPRIYAELNVLQNGLVPLLIKSAEMGERGIKIALACTDLITSLTWPMDAMAELRAAQEQNPDDFESLKRLAKIKDVEVALVSYKSCILRARSGETRGTDRDVLQTVMLNLLLPSLAKPRPNRTERDVGTISMCLYLFRNLLAIRDPIATTLSSRDAIAQAHLQSELVCAMQRAHVLETLLMLASSAETRDLEPWNAVAAECVFHIYAGTRPALLVPGATDQEVPLPKDATAKHASVFSSAASAQRSAKASALASFLSAEDNQRRAAVLSSGTTRHSRFGTSITYEGTDGQRRVARNQGAFRKTTEQLTLEAQEKARRKVSRRKLIREKGAPRGKVEWTAAARKTLTAWSERFFKLGFEPLTRSVLKDVRSEHAKLGDVDEARIRIMQLAIFFLDYFLLQRAAAAKAEAARKEARLRAAEAAKAKRALKGKGKARDFDDPFAEEVVEPEPEEELEQEQEEQKADEWMFKLVSYWLEPWAFKMVTLRSEVAHETRAWLEFVTSVQLWTVLLRLVDALSQSALSMDHDKAEGLQADLYYEGTTLEASEHIIKSYKAQSFSCLDAIIAFAHTMPRMLERYASTKENLFIRAKARANRAKARAAANGTSGEYEDDDEDVGRKADKLYQERRWEFSSFQGKMCSHTVVEACLAYLHRWCEYANPSEQLAAVVGVIHRLAIKAGSVSLFFAYDVRVALKALLAGPMLPTLEPRAPRAAKDAKQCIQFILRKFDKLSDEDKERYAAGMRRVRAGGKTGAKKAPKEIHVAPSRGHVGDVGIAVGLLSEMGKIKEVIWVKEALELACAERTEIVLDTDGENARAPTPERDEEMDGQPQPQERQRTLDEDHEPSDEAKAKFEPYHASYSNAEILTDATTLPELKMLCRLVGLESNEDDATQWKWVVPASILPSDLSADIALIEDFMREPFDTAGETLKSFVQTIRKPRAPRARRDVDFSDVSNSSNDEASARSGSGADSDADSDAAADAITAAARSKGKGRRKHARAGNDAPRKRAPKKAAKVWTKGDFIEDSDEELEIVARLIRERDAAAALARGEDPPSASDSDSGSPAARAAGPARPRARAAARAEGTHRSPARSTPGRDATTPPTSSLAGSPLPSPGARSKGMAALRARRKAGGLFIGDSEDEDEEARPPAAAPAAAPAALEEEGAAPAASTPEPEAAASPSTSAAAVTSPAAAAATPTAAADESSDIDELASEPEDALMRAASPGPLQPTPTALNLNKRSALLDSDDERAAGSGMEAPAAQMTQNKRRRAVLDSDDE